LDRTPDAAGMAESPFSRDSTSAMGRVVHGHRNSVSAALAAFASITSSHTKDAGRFVAPQACRVLVRQYSLAKHFCLNACYSHCVGLLPWILSNLSGHLCAVPDCSFDRVPHMVIAADAGALL